MKITVAKYISEFFVKNNITDVFTVTGGGAMFLNDAFGHQEGLKCTYNHHEQASAIAAEAYARLKNKIAVVCVTSGPGATNAMTGVLCGYMDSIPMFIISGQVRYDTSVRSTGLNLRSMGVQEFDIIKSVSSMTKYAEIVVDPNTIKYHLEKALYLATHRRPGPVWLDIPLNVQGAIIDTDNLINYDYKDDCLNENEISDNTIEFIIKKLKDAKRPIIIAGNGIRLSDSFDVFQMLIKNLNIPIVTTMSSIDIMESDNPLYVGRTGGTGDRAGNFAVQNSDVILSIGSRLGFFVTGFNYIKWAREAFIIANDIDNEELKKPTLKIDLPVMGDAKELIKKLYEITVNTKVFFNKDWIERCQMWKSKFPVVTEKHYIDNNGTNIYAFYKELTTMLVENNIMIAGCGTSRVSGSQASIIKNGQRFITNTSAAPMGYDLPAAVGACIGNNRKPVVCVTGEGSIQMNIQELQTIIHNRLPIKIFVINNGGYHSIRQTQTNYFEGSLVGVGPDSNDLSFPDLSKISQAYGFTYYSCSKSVDLKETILNVLRCDDAVICDVFVSKMQNTEPKISSKKLPDGKMISSTLEDMYPFLTKEELLENMIIPLADD